jgi:hypothetical protein
VSSSSLQLRLCDLVLKILAVEVRPSPFAINMDALMPSIGEFEDLRDYRPGGHHPVLLDDRLLVDRFHIAHKLGWGGYSLVWLAWDNVRRRYVALKIAKSHLSGYLQREVAALRAMNSDDVPTVLDQFELEGPNGKHACYTMSVAAGNLSTAKLDHLFTIDVARALAAKLALMMCSLHARSYCHGGRCRCSSRIELN